MKKETLGDKDSEKKIEGVEYLKRPVLEETDIPNPIQGSVKDPNKLYHFMKDLKDSAIESFVCVFVDENYHSLGNEILGHTTAETFVIKPIWRFHYLFGGKGFILITNHVNGDATPTEADKQLIQNLQIKAKVMEDAELIDYVIVADDHYWSMNTQNGTACHCGQQHHMPQ